jgi:hypothetical protein
LSGERERSASSNKFSNLPAEKTQIISRVKKLKIFSRVPSVTTRESFKCAQLPKVIIPMDGTLSCRK